MENIAYKLARGKEQIKNEKGQLSRLCTSAPLRE